MVIISKLPKKDMRLVGMVEGNPRIAELIRWHVIVEKNNRRYKMVFDNDEPTDEDIYDAFSQGKSYELVTIETLSKRLDILEVENEDLRNMVKENDAKIKSLDRSLK